MFFHPGRELVEKILIIFCQIPLSLPQKHTITDIRNIKQRNVLTHAGLVLANHRRGVRGTSCYYCWCGVGGVNRKDYHNFVFSGNSIPFYVFWELNSFFMFSALMLSGNPRILLYRIYDVKTYQFWLLKVKCLLKLHQNFTPNIIRHLEPILQKKILRRNLKISNTQKSWTKICSEYELVENLFGKAGKCE